MTNRIYLIPGLILTVLAFITTILSADDTSAALHAIVWLTLWTSVCFFLLYQSIATIRLVLEYVSFKTVFAAIFSTLFTFIFLVGEIIGIYAYSSAIPIFVMPVLFFIGVLNIVFALILKAPTLEGRKIMDQIQGFKLFLAAAEHVDKLHLPEKTPALFEKYLAYAIALGVENEWSAQFTTIPTTSYHPTWYYGPTWPPHTFPTHLNTSLFTAISSIAN